MNTTHNTPQLRADYGSLSTQRRATVRLSSNDHSRLMELKATYRAVFGRDVSDGVVFHRALATLQDHLSHLTANHSTQDVAASERVLIEKP